MLIKNAPKDAPWNVAQKSGAHNANVAEESMNLPILEENVAINVRVVKGKNPIMQIENAPKDAQMRAARISAVYNAPHVIMMMKKLQWNI